MPLPTELNVPVQRSFRDPCLGQNPTLCLAKARTTLSCHQLASLALGHWPLAMGQAPSHAVEPSSPGMERSCKSSHWSWKVEVQPGHCRNDDSILRWGRHPSLSPALVSSFKVTSHSCSITALCSKDRTSEEATLA